MRRLGAWTDRMSADAWARLGIVAIVLIANAPYWTGVFDANPLGPRASLASAVTPGPVGGQPTIDPNNGFVSQALGHRAAEDWVHLRLPWWNPYEGTGAPLAGEIQSAAMFPPTLLTLIGNGQILERMLLEAIAGLATLALLRRLGLNRWAALGGGIAFALNGSFAWFAHAPINPVAFLPLTLLGIERAVETAREGRSGGWWMIAIAVALSAYGGFPETTYIDALLAVLWFAWRWGSVGGSRRAAFLGKAVTGAVVGILLALPFLVTALAGVGHGDLGAHDSTLYGSAHIPAQALPMLLLPYVFGPILDYTGPSFQLLTIWYVVGGYLSAVLVALGLLGVFARGRLGLRLVLVIWVVLAFSRMYGQIPLLGHVIGWLPGMARIAFFRYATPSLELSVIVLAALGVHDIVTVPAHRTRLLWSGAVALAVVAAAAIGAHHLAGQLGAKYSHRPYFWVALGWAVVTVVALMAGFGVRRPDRRAAALCLVLAIDALALFVAPEASAPRHVTVDGAPARYLRAHAGNQRFFTLGTFAPNYGSYYGVPELDINDIPIPRPFSRYISRRLDPYAVPTVFVGFGGGGRSPFAPSAQTELLRHLADYREAAVSYVLVPVGQPPLPARAFALVDRSPTTDIYRLDGAAPFVSAVGCHVSAGDDATVAVDCPRTTTLTRRETDVPGWHATVDGRSVPIRLSDGLFQSLTVPAGRHTVRFAYAPPGILWGGVGLLLGLLALAAAAVRRLGIAPNRHGVVHDPLTLTGADPR